MYPIEASGQEKPSKVRRYPFIILPLHMPQEGIPEGSFYIESLVFSLSPYHSARVLADYCKFKKLDSSKFVCHPVVFARDMRQQGTGTISIQRNGDRFQAKVNWRP